VLNIFIEATVQYINVIGASCLGNRGVRDIIKYIVECIDVEGASCPSNGELCILLHPSYIKPVPLSSFYGVAANYVTVTNIRRENLRRPIIYQISGKLPLWQPGRQADVSLSLSDL
jgi:hypothetical protein